MAQLHLHVPEEVRTEIAWEWPTEEEVDEEFGAASAEAIAEEPWEPDQQRRCMHFTRRVHREASCDGRYSTGWMGS